MSSTEEAIERKQRRRSSLEQSNRNKNGVLEWTAWKRPSESGKGGGFDQGPKPVKRESIHSNIPQSWVNVALPDKEEDAEGDDSNKENVKATDKKEEKTPQEEKKEEEEETEEAKSADDKKEEEEKERLLGSSTASWEDLPTTEPTTTKKEVQPKVDEDTPSKAITTNKENWLAQNMYGLILAGLVTVAAIGMKYALTTKKDGAGA